VELEISANLAAQQRAMTDHILTVADQAGYGAALIDVTSAVPAITWPRFAHMVRAAARGLARRGLREADTAGVFVQDAVSHVLAVHAVRVAGAIAAPIRPAQSAASIAAQLKQSRARLLITSAELAELAIQASERSWVRQVFAFGDAEGTTPFGSLLQAPRHGQFQANGSGHAGEQAPAQARDLGGLQLARLEAVLRLTCRDVVVTAPPCGDPQAYTSLLDLALAAGATMVAAPLAQVADAVGVYQGTAAIVPSGMQVPGLPAERVLPVSRAEP
jgi:non-ribosomal peptide synthetase component F